MMQTPVLREEFRLFIFSLSHIYCLNMLFSLFLSHTGSVQVQVEPVGRWFEAFQKRRDRNVSASFQELEEEEELSEEEADEELQLEEYPMLKTLDPKDWKVLP